MKGVAAFVVIAFLVLAASALADAGKLHALFGQPVQNGPQNERIQVINVPRAASGGWDVRCVVVSERGNGGTGESPPAVAISCQWP